MVTRTTIASINVVLNGYVESEVNRRIASRDCWTVPGVHAVDNRIQVQH